MLRSLSLSLCRRLSLLVRGTISAQALVTALLCGISGLALVGLHGWGALEWAA